MQEIQISVQEDTYILKRESTFCEGIQRESTNGVNFDPSILLKYHHYSIWAIPFETDHMSGELSS